MLENVQRTLERRAGHIVFGSRRWITAQLADLARDLDGARILEIGSGRRDLGDDAYSFRRLFDGRNQFVQSDVDPGHGHAVVDVTTMEFEDEWDLILCISVLEHLADVTAAAQRIHRALRPGGRAAIVAPMCFPYHDEPRDYWRFTGHGLRLLLSDFDAVELRSRGPRRLPFANMAIARKATPDR